VAASSGRVILIRVAMVRQSVAILELNPTVFIAR
jgi:hypothetical protein